MLHRLSLRRRRESVLLWPLLIGLLVLLAACGESVVPTASPVVATATLPPASATPVAAPTDTPVPPPPTATAPPPAVVSSATPVPPTDTPIVPPSTVTPLPPTSTALPPTSTPPAPTAPPASPTPAPPPATPLPPSATPAAPAPTATALPLTQMPETPVPVADGDIVLVLNRELAVIHADGSGLRRLGVQGDLSQPRWSPDKSRIAFIMGYESAADLWVINADGTGVRRLTSTPGVQELDARWSPDGQTLAYTRAAGPAALREVWLVGADGGNAHRLADGMDPAWAPDGKRLAFVTNGTRSGGDPYGTNNTIDMINAQGQNRWSPVKIAGIPQDTSLVDPQAPFNAGTVFLRYPDWAPNNHAIAFMAEGHSGLIVTATDKGANPTLRDFDYEGGMGRVYWSPDGAKLIYQMLPASGINQVAALTLAPRARVVFGSPHDDVAASSPTWAPDSARLAYIQNGTSPNPTIGPAGALVVARLAAPTDLHVLIPDGAADPDWR